MTPPENMRTAFGSALNVETLFGTGQHTSDRAVYLEFELRVDIPAGNMAVERLDGAGSFLMFL